MFYKKKSCGIAIVKVYPLISVNSLKKSYNATIVLREERPSKIDKRDSIQIQKGIVKQTFLCFNNSPLKPIKTIAKAHRMKVILGREMLRRTVFGSRYFKTINKSLKIV